MTKKPIIFLDFDGVLNSVVSRSRTPDGWNKLDERMVKRVNLLIDCTGAVVVVSSSWRLFDRTRLTDGERLERLQKLLDENGFYGWVHGFTPDPRPGEVRGQEIQAWLDINEHRGPFVILDDDDDMAHLLPYLIQTQDYEGLQDRHVEAAVELLFKNLRGYPIPLPDPGFDGGAA